MATKQSPFHLARLRIKNFRSIGEANIPLGPLTILVGQNGSGKSNVVDALRFLRDSLTKGLDQAILDREGLTVLRRWSASGRPTDISLGVTIHNDDREVVAYDFILSAHSQQGFSVKREELRIEAIEVTPICITCQGNTLILVRNGKKQTQKLQIPPDKDVTSRLRGPANMAMMLSHFDKGAKPISRPNSTMPLSFYYERYAWTLLQVLRGSLFYTLNPVQLRAPQRLIQETPFDEAGQNLAAVLQHLRRTKHPTEEVRQTLARLMAGIVDFSVETTGSYLVTYLHYKNAAGNTRRADLGQESDGTLRVLGILAALFQRKSPVSRYPTQQLLTIEEPEVNIHPGMLAVLADLFREASHRNQILLTTHSPDLLDFLPPESFLVVEKVDGETQVGLLATNQAEIVRQRLFSAGELLRTEGLHRQVEPVQPVDSQPA